MQPWEFVEYLGQVRAAAILRTSVGEAVAPAIAAAIRGGFEIVEITLNTPGALEHIAELSQRPELTVGAGTVLTPQAAKDAAKAGATFLVSPVCDEDVIETAAVLGVAAMPGTFTPSELLRAHRAGAPLQKLFPAPDAGPAYVRACLGPLPFLRIVPTSGVTAANAAAFLAAGAHALGFVAPLFDPTDMQQGRFDRIETRARELLQIVRTTP